MASKDPGGPPVGASLVWLPAAGQLGRAERRKLGSPRSAREPLAGFVLTCSTASSLTCGPMLPWSTRALADAGCTHGPVSADYVRP